MKQKKITVLDTDIQPGEMANLAIALPKIYSCAPMYMPIKIAHGKNPGPTVLVFSGLHGYELNGIEIINQLMDDKCLDDLSGTVIAIPALNIFGVMNYPKHLPHAGTLDECFPGSKDGRYGDRVAYLFTQEFLTKADYCIDLSSGGTRHDKLPQIFCNYADQKLKKLASEFKAPVITEVTLKPGSLLSLIQDMGLPFLVYQGGEGYRHNLSAITTGLEGIKNILCYLKMIKLENTNLSHDNYNPVFSMDSDWVVSHSSGVFRAKVELGELVKTNQVIGEISDPFSPDFIDYVRSNTNGIVVGINTHPLVYEGQTIIMVSSFVDNQKAEEMVEKWSDEYEEETST